MNLMVASGGWSWTLVTFDTREAYLAALEQASAHRDIRPLTRSSPTVSTPLQEL